jgi:agmatine deiminase
MKQLILSLILLMTFAEMNGQNAYFPPEFEKQEGLLLTWDYHDLRNPVTAAVAKAVQPSATVWIIYYPGQAPMDTIEIRDFLRDHGVPDENVHLIPAWTETLWIRDYGPFTGYDLQSLPPSRYFVDAGYSNYNRPRDDSIPTQLANYWGIPAVDMPLQFEGGNVLFDGTGRGWGSTRIFEQNSGYSQTQVKEMMEEFFGLDDFMFLQKLTNSGGGLWAHVDMYMKILDSETIMINEYPDHVPDYFLIESFAMLLGEMTNFDGTPYRIVRIPAPPKADGTWAVTQNDEMRTYTNSIIINDVIVVPSYNLPEYDSAAKQIYSENMPGYRIEMVDATVLTPLYGALHCITKEVTKPEYLRIRHKKITGEQEYTRPYVVIDARIDCNLVADSSYVYYRFNGSETFERVPLAPGCPYYVGVIQDVQPTDTIDYYLYTARNGDEVALPPPAPAGYYTFWFDQTVSVDQLAQEPAKLHIYPNPSDGYFTVINPDPFNSGILEITDIFGKQLVRKVLQPGTVSLNLSATLSSGVYMLRFQTKNFPVIHTKLVIEK